MRASDAEPRATERAAREQYDYDDEAFVPVYAVDTMPVWGRVLAWVIFVTPYTWFRNTGLVAAMFAVWRGWWVAYMMAGVTAALFLLAYFGRRRIPSPFRAIILVEREKDAS